MLDFTSNCISYKHTRIALLSDALDLPKPFGPYTLLRRLAVGGMAEVYVAKAKGIGGFEKLVAIKVIHPQFSEDQHFIKMLVDEAKVSVQLTHVNIGQTFDLQLIEDTYCISMEYIEGADAYRVQRRAHDQKLALPLDVAIFVVSEICNALGYAHRKRDGNGAPMGIVHRDISPQNVLISYSGEVKLVDFGIAKVASRGGQTEVGVIKGKYYYMSPEQAWGDPVDARTDVFSAGLLLHELLTGQMVYQEDNIPALLDRVRKARVPSPRDLRPEVPQALAEMVLKACAKEPGDRYQSATALAKDLQELLYAESPTFAPSRVAQLMATLFPDEVRRHSDVLKVPTAEEERAAKATREIVSPPAPSEELSLPSMSRQEFAPKKETSVIFDLADVDIESMTRNDILPFRKSGTAPIAEPPVDPADKYNFGDTSEVASASESWDEETFLKKEGDWDDSTMTENDGKAMQQIRALIAARHREQEAASEVEPDELQGEKTVAMASYPLPPALEPDAPRPLSAPSPATPRRVPPPPVRRAATSPSVPPPAALPPKPLSVRPSPARPLSIGSPSAASAPPARAPSPPAYRSEEPAELVGEATMALSPDQLPRAPLDESDPLDLPAEKTVAFQEGMPSPPPRRAGPIAGPSAGGIRLGPEAARFFASGEGGDPFAPRPPAPAGPFDPIGAPLQASAVSPGHDPFAVRPAPAGFTGAHEALGKPEPRKWLLPIMLVAASVLMLVAVGAWVAARPDPTTLELSSIPEGATVRVDGEELPHATPTTLEDLVQDDVHRVRIDYPGYESQEAEVRLVEGENKRMFLLNPIRATLHIETSPPGAQVWVDNAIRGSAPLDIRGLTAGQTIRVRCASPGRETVTREVTIGVNERAATLTIELAPAEP